MKICNFCLEKNFGPQGSRANVRCLKCGSLERHRLLKIIIDNKFPSKNKLKVFYISPEKCLFDYLKLHFDLDCVDLQPNHNQFGSSIRKLDLCSDLGLIKNDTYDLILHSHVLEHLNCALGYILFELSRILKPTGLHIFIAPFMGGYYHVDSDPGLSSQERNIKFGQSDHIRKFGNLNSHDFLGKYIQISTNNELGLDPLDLIKFNIEDNSKNLNLNSVQVKTKADHIFFNYLDKN